MQTTKPLLRQKQILKAFKKQKYSYQPVAHVGLFHHSHTLVLHLFAHIFTVFLSSCCCIISSFYFLFILVFSSSPKVTNNTLVGGKSLSNPVIQYFSIFHMEFLNQVLENLRDQEGEVLTKEKFGMHE